jgi:hypothetical protein
MLGSRRLLSLMNSVWRQAMSFVLRAARRQCRVSIPSLDLRRALDYRSTSSPQTAAIVHLQKIVRLKLALRTSLLSYKACVKT